MGRYVQGCEDGDAVRGRGSVQKRKALVREWDATKEWTIRKQRKCSHAFNQEAFNFGWYSDVKIPDINYTLENLQQL